MVFLVGVLSWISYLTYKHIHPDGTADSIKKITTDPGKLFLYFYLIIARKRSFGQGNLVTPVCQLFCSESGVYPSMQWVRSCVYTRMQFNSGCLPRGVCPGGVSTWGCLRGVGAYTPWIERQTCPGRRGRHPRPPRPPDLEVDTP